MMIKNKYLNKNTRVFIFTGFLLLLASCSTNYRGYPAELKPYIQANRYPVGNNIMVVKYLEFRSVGWSKKDALERARKEYLELIKWLEKNNPDHLRNKGQPLIKTI